MQKNYGTSQDTRLIPALLPEFAKIDDRDLSDLLAYVVDYTKYIPFYDHQNDSDEKRDWSAFFLNDITMVLAQICTYDVKKIDQRRFDLVQNVLAKDRQTNWFYLQIQNILIHERIRLEKNNSSSEPTLLLDTIKKIISREKKRRWPRENIKNVFFKKKRGQQELFSQLFPKEKDDQLISLLIKLRRSRTFQSLPEEFMTGVKKLGDTNRELALNLIQVLLDESISSSGLMEKIVPIFEEENNWETTVKELLSLLEQVAESLEVKLGQIEKVLDIFEGKKAGKRAITKILEGELSEKEKLSKIADILKPIKAEIDLFNKVLAIFEETLDNSEILGKIIELVKQEENSEEFASDKEKAQDLLEKAIQHKVFEEEKSFFLERLPVFFQKRKDREYILLSLIQHILNGNNNPPEELLNKDVNTVDFNRKIDEILWANEKERNLLYVLQRLQELEEPKTVIRSKEEDEHQKDAELLEIYFDKLLEFEQERPWSSEFEKLNELIYDLALEIDKWLIELRNIRFRELTRPHEIEKEIVYLIKNKLALELKILGKIAPSNIRLKYSRLKCKEWNAHDDEDEQENIKVGELENRRMQTLIKETVRIYRSFYNDLLKLKSIAPKFFLASLVQKQDHVPPAGILITFLQLFRHSQNHLNTLTRRHLEYYYEKLLSLEYQNLKPDEVFVFFEPGTFEGRYKLKEGTQLQTEKNDLGYGPIFETTSDLELSYANIGSLMSLYVSENQNIDMGSSFQLISNIYAAPVANSKDGLGAPLLVNQKSWSLFGEDQLTKTTAEKSMIRADVGLVISSPVLLLKGGNRFVSIKFEFVESSMKNYRVLMEDLCEKNPMDFADVFHKVFQNSLSVQLSGEEGWIDILDYELIPPKNIVDNLFEICFRLDSSQPAIVPLNAEHLNTSYNSDFPVAKILIGGIGANYTYSFVKDLTINKIFINTEVDEIKNLELYNNLGKIDSSIPFQPFGPIPLLGSYLVVGYPEAFRKNITDLSFHFEWLNTPQISGGLASYYESYNTKWDNSSFKINIKALNNNVFSPKEELVAQVMSLFRTKKKEGEEYLESKTSLNEIEIEKFELRPNPYLKPVENFDNTTISGFFKLELISPKEGFGHEIYPRIFTQAVTESAKNSSRSLFRSEASIAPPSIPNEPYTPVLKSLSMSYKAKAVINMALMEGEERDASLPESVFHIYPFGHQLTFAEGRVLDAQLLPQLDENAYFFIGLFSLDPPQKLNIYFEIEGSKKGLTSLKKPDVSWSYLSKNIWLPFSKEKILKDSTGGLSRSGIISLDIPYDISLNNTKMPPNQYWLRVALKGDAGIIGRARVVKPHGVKAKWVVDDEGQRQPDEPIPPHSIISLVKDQPQIAGVFQPFPSFGGQQKENNNRFYTRISERLQHKGRAVTHSDIERLVLGAFPYLAQVKCLSKFLYPNEEALSYGKLIVVVIPRPDSFNILLEPKANIHQLLEIKDFLKKRISGFVDVEVRNPAYEKVKINCNVVFTDKEKRGLLIAQLNKDINAYLAPWMSGIQTIFQLGGSLSKEAIINFIEKRPYIKFVTKFSIIQIISPYEDYHLVRDTAFDGQSLSLIMAYKPWSVLVPFEQHQITYIDEEVYKSPEASTLENISVGVDFIVRDEEQEKPLYEDENQESSTSDSHKENDSVKTFILNQDFDPEERLDNWNI